MSDVHLLHDHELAGADASRAAEDPARAAADAASRLRRQASVLARRSAKLTRRAALALRDEAGATRDRGVAYVRSEPVKSVVIAAGVGAVLTGLLLTLWGRQGD